MKVIVQTVPKCAGKGVRCLLRKQHSLAHGVLVFIRTSPFRPEAQYSRMVAVPLRRATADTHAIVGAALLGLKSIYQTGYKYAKAGVLLQDLQNDTVIQQELDLEGEGEQGRERLMTAMDTLNQRFGKGTVTVGSAGLAGEHRVWAMRQERRTPGYTTRWEDMPVARA